MTICRWKAAETTILERRGGYDASRAEKFQRRMRSLFCFALLALAAASPAFSQEQPQPETVRLQAPAENTTVIGKKPRIRFAIATPYAKDGFVVMLDNEDVTGVLDPTADGFEYAPRMAVMPGPHTLSIRFLGQDGSEVQRQFAFTTRHGEKLEAAYSNNNLTVLVEDLSKKPAGAAGLPESKVEANLSSDSRLATENAVVTLTTNLRYLNQSAPVYAPQKRGVVDAANWIVTAAYTKDRFRLDAAVGDISVEQTPYTLTNFARRGGKLGVDFDDRYHVELFSTTSRQFTGFREGDGIGLCVDDHVVGVSAGAKFRERTIELKTIYVNGGAQDGSFGMFSLTNPTQRGETTGLLLNTDLFSGRLRTEFEADLSRFDPDYDDDLAAMTDRAYRVKANGFVDRYNYEALYEHVGRDYAVVGNQWLQKDREGVSFRGGANFDGQGVSMNLSQYHNNVRKDELFPRTVSEQSAVDYQYSKIANLTLGITYQTGRQESENVPAGSLPVAMRTEGTTGRIGYAVGKIAIGLQAGFSRMDDQTDANRDSKVVTYTVTPSYNSPGLSVNPVFTLNEATDLASDVTTDTTTVNLDVRSLFAGGKFAADLGGAYAIAKTDDNLMDQRMLNAAFRVAYNFQDWFRDYLRPSLGLRGSHARTRDLISGSSTEETTLFIVLAASMPFSF